MANTSTKESTPISSTNTPESPILTGRSSMLALMLLDLVEELIKEPTKHKMVHIHSFRHREDHQTIRKSRQFPQRFQKEEGRWCSQVRQWHEICPRQVPWQGKAGMESIRTRQGGQPNEQTEGWGLPWLHPEIKLNQSWESFDLSSQMGLTWCVSVSTINNEWVLNKSRIYNQLDGSEFLPICEYIECWVINWGLFVFLLAYVDILTGRD